MRITERSAGIAADRDADRRGPWRRQPELTAHHPGGPVGADDHPGRDVVVKNHPIRAHNQAAHPVLAQLRPGRGGRGHQP
ncbi:MAG: hypothetical protein JWO98_5393, partial [Frankiales bacterium]|nr:hypothetical protein [Frankiales bacterium]